MSQPVCKIFAKGIKTKMLPKENKSFKAITYISAATSSMNFAVAINNFIRVNDEISMVKNLQNPIERGIR